MVFSLHMLFLIFCLKEGWVVPKILYNKIHWPWSLDSYAYPCSSGKYLQKGLRNVWLWHVDNKLRNRCYSIWPWFQMIFDQHVSLTTWTHLVLCPSIIDRHTFDFDPFSQRILHLCSTKRAKVWSKTRQKED